MFEKEILQKLQQYSSPIKTVGLPSATVEKFAAQDPRLVQAIKSAHQHYESLKATMGHIFALPEHEQINYLQAHILNFYATDAVNPYVALAAKGPWIVTTRGAIVYDTGGYGMLGFGQNHPQILAALSKEQVIANVMTANFIQRRFTDKLGQMIGAHLSTKQCPYKKFVCLNSGSEAVSLACRLSDSHALAKQKQGYKIKFLALDQGFHGRTDRPAQASSSSIKAYRKYLASFQTRDNLETVIPNDIQGLREAFAQAAKHKVHFEAFLMEPVMGEGNPGYAITPEFYSEARALTKQHNTMLIVDSIQAGLRTHGCLSIVDYPGFERVEAPDAETFSKALNSGQYPVSVVGLTEKTVECYKTGLYGNTMTTNPRALEVGLAVLELVTPAIKQNIKERGRQALANLQLMQEKYPKIVTGYQGTGLIFSLSIHDSVPVVGEQGLELQMRCQGIGVIHGGPNSLRFTPAFDISQAEMDLVFEVLDRVLSKAAKS